MFQFQTVATQLQLKTIQIIHWKYLETSRNTKQCNMSWFKLFFNERDLNYSVKLRTVTNWCTNTHILMSLEDLVFSFDFFVFNFPPYKQRLEIYIIQKITNCSTLFSKIWTSRKYWEKKNQFNYWYYSRANLNARYWTVAIPKQWR